MEPHALKSSPLGQPGEGMAEHVRVNGFSGCAENQIINGDLPAQALK